MMDLIGFLFGLFVLTIASGAIVVIIRREGATPKAAPNRYYDWAKEKSELRGKTASQQREILNPWIEGVVWDMGCSKYEAERFFQINLSCVLK